MYTLRKKQKIWTYVGSLINQFITPKQKNIGMTYEGSYFYKY